MKERWTEQQAWDWYNARPWITGFNFIPSGSISGIELFQEYGHDEAFRDAAKELALQQALVSTAFVFTCHFTSGGCNTMHSSNI